MNALVFEVHAVKMPVGFGKALKTMGRVVEPGASET